MNMLKITPNTLLPLMNDRFSQVNQLRNACLTGTNMFLKVEFILICHYLYTMLFVIPESLKRPGMINGKYAVMA